MALWIRELFDTLDLVTVVKTSGAKGLQVYLPLNTHVTYAQTKPLARAVAELLEREHPKLVVSRHAQAPSRGKVLIDWSQNDRHKTTVSVYSLRARRGADDLDAAELGGGGSGGTPPSRADPERAAPRAAGAGRTRRRPLRSDARRSARRCPSWLRPVAGSISR